MKFSNFMFTAAENPADDYRIINETLREAKLCDELGMDTLWLGEHHFDGICAYVDPVSFAAALATATKDIKIGFAVAQMSLHHPIRMAEQMSLIDNISNGRLIVGLGRGTAYNIYDYQGYGIDPNEAQARLIESEEIMIKAWTTENMVHKGEFWDIRLPLLRPRPFTHPHPYMIRACSGEESMVAMAKAGRPFMMNVQSNDVTKHRMELYQQTMRDSGFDDERIAQNMSECWLWRNVCVADTDAEAAEIGIPAFHRQTEFRGVMRARIHKEQGVTLAKTPVAGVVQSKPARAQVEHSLLYGSPDTVAEKIAEIDKFGAGGLIMTFRLGPMDIETTEKSIRLFMTKVAPQFN
ncbi:MAG: LLM class flavin-dependent oxidoreductase [Alphaproteobacteria bacterium]|nr:LLM class flavin-dependent oxidoreductase [Alphaproteobacteria bacterium]